MDTIIGALIAAIVTLGATWLGMLHYFKQRQRELKETAYIEYVQNFQQLIILTNPPNSDETQEIKEAQHAYAKSTAKLYLLGDKKVIHTLSQFDTNTVYTKEDNDKKHEIYESLVKSMRKDLKLDTDRETQIRVKTLR